MDVTNFFDSILEPAVYRAFFDIGYQPLVAFELSRICTRLRKTGNVKRESEENYKISSYDSRHLGHLPQGAPTSPILSNIVSIELDRAIEEKAASFGLRYTRYADDITLSAREKFTRDDAHKVISECYKIMSGFGMWPNRAKTRVIPPGARKIVLGLLVDGDVPRLTREFREEMRTHLHYLERCGAASHAKARKFDSVLGLQNHLFGMAAYGAGVDKQWGRATLRRLAGISWPVRFVMPP